MGKLDISFELMRRSVGVIEMKEIVCIIILNYSNLSPICLERNCCPVGGYLAPGAGQTTLKLVTALRPPQHHNTTTPQHHAHHLTCWSSQVIAVPPPLHTEAECRDNELRMSSVPCPVSEGTRGPDTGGGDRPPPSHRRQATGLRALVKTTWYQGGPRYYIALHLSNKWFFLFPSKMIMLIIFCSYFYIVWEDFWHFAHIIFTLFSKAWRIRIPKIRAGSIIVIAARCIPVIRRQIP